MGKRKIDHDAVERVVGALIGGADMAIAATAVPCTRQALYLHMRNFPKDKARIEEAKLIADDVIVQCLHDAAKDGNITAMIFWLKNRRPVEWRDKHDLEHTGDVTYRIKYAEGKDDPLVS